MKICEKCSVEMGDGYKFCAICGASIHNSFTHINSADSSKPVVCDSMTLCFVMLLLVGDYGALLGLIYSRLSSVAYSRGDFQKAALCANRARFITFWAILPSVLLNWYLFNKLLSYVIFQFTQLSEFSHLI